MYYVAPHVCYIHSTVVVAPLRRINDDDDGDTYSLLKFVVHRIAAPLLARKFQLCNSQTIFYPDTLNSNFAIHPTPLSLRSSIIFSTPSATSSSWHIEQANALDFRCTFVTAIVVVFRTFRIPLFKCTAYTPTGAKATHAQPNKHTSTHASTHARTHARKPVHKAKSCRRHRLRCDDATLYDSQHENRTQAHERKRCPHCYGAQSSSAFGTKKASQFAPSLCHSHTHR